MNLSLFIVLYFCSGFVLHYIWGIWVPESYRDKIGYYELPQPVRKAVFWSYFCNPFVMLHFTFVQIANPGSLEKKSDDPF